MARFIRKHSKKIGMPPGSLIHVGDKKTDKTVIDLINYQTWG